MSSRRALPGAEKSLTASARAVADQGGNDVTIADVRNLDLGAQPVEGQTPGEVADAVAPGIEQQTAIAVVGDEEIEQELSLRREQCGIDGAGRIDLVDVVGNDTLQEGARRRGPVTARTPRSSSAMRTLFCMAGSGDRESVWQGARDRLAWRTGPLPSADGARPDTAVYHCASPRKTR